MANLRDVQALLDRINRTYKELGKNNPFSGKTAKEAIEFFGTAESAADNLASSLKEARAELVGMESGLDSLSERFADISRELGTFTGGLKNAQRAFNKLNSLAGQLEDIQYDMADSSVKEVRALRQKIGLAFKRLKAEKEALKMQIKLGEAAGKNVDKEKELLAIAEDREKDLQRQVGYQQEFNATLKETEKRVRNIKNATGLTGKIIGGLGKGLEKAGFGDLSEDLDLAKEAMNDMAVDLTENGKKAAGLGGQFRIMGAGLKSLAGSIVSALKDPLVIVGLLVKAIKFLVSIVGDLQKKTAMVAQNFGLAEAEARKFYNQVNRVGDATGEIFYFNEELIAAQHEVNKAVGLNLKFNEENAKTMQDLTQYMGMSAENAGMLFRISAQMGKGFRETADEVAGIVDGLNSTTGMSLTTNQVFDEIGKASSSIRFNIQGGFEGMVKSAHTAARLAMSMNEIADAARSTLNFEDSIANEMNAELFLQKDLNLERFRAAALTGDTTTQAAELERLIKENMGGLEGNVLAQEAFANALGISNEQLSESMLKIKEGKSLQEEQSDAAQGTTSEIAEMGKNAVRFERSLEAAIRAFKSSLLPLAKALEPIFISVANNIAKMGTFFSTKTGKVVAAIAGIAAGGVILFKAGKGLLNMFTGGMFKQGGNPGNPLYTYNVNESGGGGGGDAMDFMRRAGGRRAGFGGGFRGFLGKGGYGRDLLKGGRRGMVARARTFRGLKDIAMGGSGTFVGGTGTGSKIASQTVNLAKSTSALSKASTALTKVAGPLAIADLAVGGFTGYGQAQMSAEEQKAAGVKEGIGSVEASLQGVLTGGAEKGSMFSSTLGIEKGSAGDEALGIVGSAGRGALTGAAIGSVIPVVGTAVGAAVGGIVGAVSEGFKVFTDPNSSLRKGLSAGIDFMGEKLSEGWEATKKFGSEIFDSLKGAASSAWETTKDVASKAYNGLKSVGSSIVSGVSSAASWVGGLFGFANGGIAPGGFRAFANGGMVTSPTIGLVGEGGMNEAIVPLPDGKSIPVQMAGGGSSQEVASLLRELVTLVKQGGDVYLDGNKVGKSLALATSKMG